MRLKVTVHTKSGKKLTYYPESWDNEEQAKNFWLRAVGNETVQFGRFAMHVSNIDYVEFL